MGKGIKHPHILYALAHARKHTLDPSSVPLSVPIPHWPGVRGGHYSVVFVDGII